MLRYAIALPKTSVRPTSMRTVARRTAWATAFALLLCGRIANAQTQDAIAEQLNEEGKGLMINHNPAEAAKRFADAARRSPNARYSYNLCKAYHFQGLFFEALEACNSARKLDSDKALEAKINDLEGLIRAAAAQQGIDLTKPPTTKPDPTATPDPANPNPPVAPTVQPQPPRGVPPSGLYAAIAPRHEYVWTVGVDLLGGAAAFDSTDTYGTSFGGIRLRVDYLIAPSLQLGVQGNIDAFEISDNGLAGNPLSVFNFGGAVYKHFCFGALCVTPLAGLELGTFDDAALGDNKFKSAALGARVEGGVSYAFGSRYEHVIGVQLGVMGYAKPADTDTLMFNEGGSVTYLALGYTHRFSTPFGSAPILGLE
jgi:hypothetical protein